MEHLNLWKQRRGHVSDDVWTHAGITSLVLVENEVSEISEKPRHLTRLQMLVLGHNRLTHKSRTVTWQELHFLRW